MLGQHSPITSRKTLKTIARRFNGQLRSANNTLISLKSFPSGMRPWYWARSSYFVQPKVILHWVNYLQERKQKGELPADVWITSSDNFASWGGADASYHKADLTALMQAVDYLSIHTYPFHDSHYNADFGWKKREWTLFRKTCRCRHGSSFGTRNRTI